jgi:plastocyanin
MTAIRRSSRHAREAAVAEQAARQRGVRARAAGFLAVVVVVLGMGLYLAGGVFLGQRGATDVAAAIPMRISMAGFDPPVLNAKPGQTLTVDWWNTDGALHLQGGVHTLVSEALGIRLELAANSRETVTITAPLAPGDYDFWCDSCCGGRESPTMHGILHVSV